MTPRTLTRSTLVLSIVATFGCSTPRTQRVPVAESIAAPPRAYARPAPRQQVMIGHTGMPDAPEQRVVAPGMSEEQRSELLREAGSPIRPYTPAPFQPTRTVHYGDGSTQYETVYYGPSGWDRARPWVEAGMWTAFLTAPFFMCGFD
jgi:hypothetical protein